MTTDFILEYYKSRMKELKVCDYLIDHKTYILQPGEELQIDSSNVYHYFPFDTIGVAPGVKIISELSILDLSNSTLTNENHFEHTGMIQITNTAPQRIFLMAITVTPKSNPGNDLYTEILA